MKKIIIVTFGVSLILLSCGKKENEGNKAVIKNEQVETINEETLRYVASDGSSALVTFKDENGEKSISIYSNKKRIDVPHDRDGVYRKDDIQVVSKGDSVTITQGENVIELKKARGQ